MAQMTRYIGFRIVVLLWDTRADNDPRRLSALLSVVRTMGEFVFVGLIRVVCAGEVRLIPMRVI